MQKLFSMDKTQSIITRFKIKLDGFVSQTDFDREIKNIIILVLGSMEKHGENWDQLCQININWIGERFINKLSDEQLMLTKEHLHDICAMCFRFFFELYLSQKNDLTMEFESVKQYIFENLDLFETHAREQISYAIRDMPITIFKEILKSDSIVSIKDFNAVSAKAETLKQQWDDELLAKEIKVNKLKESLEKYENGFNFVGLYQGFDDLSVTKKTEQANLLFWLKILSAIIMIPIFAELMIIYSHIDEIDKIRDGLLFSILPTISLIAISLYYFRILLFNYKSVKAQLLQIELRKTLCRFIQNYTDYSSVLKKQDATSLSKFENIIFSQIVSDDGNLPSTIDGVEQITSLLKAIKS